LFIQALFSFVIVGFIGILSELLVFGRLKRIKASPRSLTVASIGIGLIIRNLLSMIFGDFPKAKTVDCATCTDSSTLPSWLDLRGVPIIKDIFPEISNLLPNFRASTIHISFVQDPIVGKSLFPDLFPILGSQEILITGFELFIILMSIIMVIAVDFMFKSTKFGIAMRATADSTELAQVSGINTKRIIYYTWFLAAGLTGFGATFVRANQARFSTYDGFWLLLPIFAVVILGGVGSFRGGIIAALIIAFTRQITNILFTQFQITGGLEDILEQLTGFTITFSPNYMDGIAFVVLILVLLIRPQGIYGSVESTRERV
jgi:branched-subunit amino acid ABC-type transport system permease component